MEILIASAGVGILLFICLYLGFRTGLRLGMQAARGQAPPRIDPVGAVTRAVAGASGSSAQSELLRGYGAMMGYTGEPKQGV